MPFAYVNDIRLFYQNQGAGHPLVLIPGVGYGGWFWHRIVDRLSERYQLIVPDPRGMGQSEESEGPYTVELLAQDIADLLDGLHIRGAFVLGHALGAYVALQLVLSRPELVSKLVLASADFAGPNIVLMDDATREALANREGAPLDLVRQRIEIATAPGFVEDQPEVAQALIDYRLSDVVSPEAYQAQLAASAAMQEAEASFEDRLAGIQVPTLVLAGEHDRIVPPGNAELLAERIPNAQVKILPNAGHLFPIEVPDATVEAVTEFLGGQKYAG